MTMRRIMPKVIGVAIIVIAFVLTSTPMGRVSIKTTLFTAHLIPNTPVSPLEILSKSPTSQKISFKTSNGKPASADLYLPHGNSKHPAVIFFMGVMPPNRNDERIIRMTEGLARSGTIVLVPWLETQNDQRIVKGDIDTLVDAYHFLESHNRVLPKKIGFAGICTGASIATIAAQDPAIRHKVYFLNSFAGYFDAKDLIKAVSTNTKFYKGTFEDWIPDGLTTSLVNQHLIYGASEKDKRILEKILSNGYWTKNDQNSISPQGQATLNIISGSDLVNVDEAIENLPNRTKKDLEEISPSTNVANLHTKVLLMHDSSDMLIPSEESKRFADELSKLGRDVYHTEFTFFKNVLEVHKSENETTGISSLVTQAFKLYLHMYNVMWLLSQ